MLGNPFSKFELAGFLAEVHEKLGYLVRIHARCGNLDCSCPVEIVVAEIEGELLYYCFLERGVVVCYIVVSR